MAHPKLKIVLARPSDSEEHAKALVTQTEKNNLENTYEPKPRGVPHHAAVIPELCDDCGETYWNKAGNRWGSHIGCLGAPRKGGSTGF